MAVSYSEYMRNGGNTKRANEETTNWEEEMEKRKKKRKRPYSQDVLRRRLMSS